MSRSVFIVATCALFVCACIAPFYTVGCSAPANLAVPDSYRSMEGWEEQGNCVHTKIITVNGQDIVIVSRGSSLAAAPLEPR